jgi:CubicO group peptidase (beta-lactamase class C family)
MLLTSLGHGGTCLAMTKFDEKFQIYDKVSGPGFAAMVIKNGQTVYQNGFGVRKIDPVKEKSRSGITQETNFNLASNSKQFTAMAVLLLEQAGKISSDDSLGKFIPEIPEYMRSIKIDHLIHHTSGLPDYMEVCSQKTKVFNADILQTLFKKDRLLFRPGSKFDYSNSGYVVLSEVVQRVAKKSFPDFVRDEIFRKLGMDHSVVFSDATEGQIVNRAIGYGPWPFFKENDFSPCNFNFGDGGVYTNLTDYKKWITFLENPDALLKPGFKKKLFIPGGARSKKDAKYGYGWLIQETGKQRMIFHKGGWVGFRSIIVYLPEMKTWAIVFSNYKGIDLDEVAESLLKEFSSVTEIGPFNL